MPDTRKTVTVPDKPNVKTGGDILTIVLGFLSVLKLVAAAPPFNFEIPQESIDAYANLAAWAVASYAVYKNTYGVTKRAKQQKAVLEQTGLKKKSG